MHRLEFTDDELDVLHELMLAGIRDETLPECTWTDECIACQLIDKITDAWIAKRDEGKNGDLS